MKLFLLLLITIPGFMYIKFCQQDGQDMRGTNSSRYSDTLPLPYATNSVRNNSKVIGWPPDLAPTAPEGFTVSRFADNLNNPRWVYVAGNGDVFVCEPGKKNDIILLRDDNKDGIAESKNVFLTGLNRPFGMLIIDNKFYVANTNGLMEFPYEPGATGITAEGKKIVDLPAGGYNNHWTRNIIANDAGTKIYITVGSGSNNGENGMDKEIRRANILEINPDGTGEKIYASGLRNPVGISFEPVTKMIWAAVNERDELGDDLVPDYATSVQPGGFYGWPYSYYGANTDPRMKDDPHIELVNKAIVPDVALGAHTASLGLAF